MRFGSSSANGSENLYLDLELDLWWLNRNAIVAFWTLMTSLIIYLFVIRWMLEKKIPETWKAVATFEIE